MLYTLKSFFIILTMIAASRAFAGKERFCNNVLEFPASRIVRYPQKLAVVAEEQIFRDSQIAGSEFERVITKLFERYRVVRATMNHQPEKKLETWNNLRAGEFLHLGFFPQDPMTDAERVGYELILNFMPREGQKFSLIKKDGNFTFRRKTIYNQEDILASSKLGAGELGPLISYDQIKTETDLITGNKILTYTSRAEAKIGSRHLVAYRMVLEPIVVP